MIVVIIQVSSWLWGIYTFFNLCFLRSLCLLLLFNWFIWNMLGEWYISRFQRLINF